MGPLGLIFIGLGGLLLRQVFMGRVDETGEDLKDAGLAVVTGDFNTLSSVLARNGHNFSGADFTGTETDTPSTPSTLDSKPVSDTVKTKNTAADGSTIVTVKADYGPSFSVAFGEQDKFVGFVNALGATGYKITTIDGYSDRNIAGSSRKSMHAYGRAIDINPTQNPVTDYPAPVKTNLPANVEAIAAQYGLTWGGSPKFKKHDAMHFSDPLPGWSY